jgi:hypothetical protein
MECKWINARPVSKSAPLLEGRIVGCLGLIRSSVGVVTRFAVHGAQHNRSGGFFRSV